MNQCKIFIYDVQTPEEFFDKSILMDLSNVLTYVSQVPLKKDQRSEKFYLGNIKIGDERR